MAVKQHSSMAIAIAAVAESTINTALSYDPASKHAVSELTGIIALEVTPVTMLTVTVFCTGTVHGLRVMNHCTSPITTRLSGSPIALLRLLQRPHSLADSGVDMSGNIELLQRWQVVLDNLDIDWQECLQHYLGDIAGPIMATTIGKAGHWLQHQFHYHQRQLSVYLQEEIRLVPAKAEFDHFHRQVDELILAADRLDARVQQVHAKLNSSGLKNKSAQVT